MNHKGIAFGDDFKSCPKGTPLLFTIHAFLSFHVRKTGFCLIVYSEGTFDPISRKEAHHDRRTTDPAAAG